MISEYIDVQNAWGSWRLRRTKGHLGCGPPINEAAFSVKGIVYNSWYKSFTLVIKCNVCKTVIRYTTSQSLNLFVIYSIYFPSIKKTISVLLFWEDNKFRNQNYCFYFHLNIISPSTPSTHCGTASPTRIMNNLG